jgi:hypothetical protein
MGETDSSAHGLETRDAGEVPDDDDWALFDGVPAYARE